MEHGSVKTIPRDEDGRLPGYAWPGGYPILYLDKDNCTLCPDCANREEEHYSKGRFSMLAGLPVHWYIHYEGPPAFCEECNKEIESAYGDPDEEKVGNKQDT